MSDLRVLQCCDCTEINYVDSIRAASQ